jgi:hypothetical protein
VKIYLEIGADDATVLRSVVDDVPFVNFGLAAAVVVAGRAGGLKVKSFSFISNKCFQFQLTLLL